MNRNHILKAAQSAGLAGCPFKWSPRDQLSMVIRKALLLLVVVPCLLAADSPVDSSGTPADAVKKVQEGLQHFRNSEFSSAETAFAEASEISPENSIILFDEACAALAGNDPDQARGLFRKAALAKDASLAVKAHYNLGCLEADQARAKLGEQPEAVEGELREECINLLLTSIRSYRDVLKLETTHKDARHNIELIRLYIKHLQSQWAERDKQKARDEKDLLQFLKMIEDRQVEIRGVTKALGQGQDSAYLRQAAMQTAESLRSLQEEIEPLKQKITEQLQGSTGGPPQGQGQVSNGGQVDPQQQQAEQLLHQMADQIGTRLLDAAGELDDKQFSAAWNIQTEGLDQTNQLYMAVAPYQNVLQRAISEQQTLIPQQDSAAEEPASSEQESSGEKTSAESMPGAASGSQDVDPQTAATPSGSTPSADSDSDIVVSGSPKDFVQLAETQSRITDFSDVLSLKAESELPQVEQQLEALRQSMPEQDSARNTEPANDPTEDDLQAGKQEDAPELTEEQKAAMAQQQQMQQQLKQLNGLAESMKLAMELAPQAARHSQTASESLVAEDLDAALPEQTETQRILKKIAEPLVNDDQNNQDQQQDQDDQKDEQENKDDQQQDKEGEQKKDEPQDGAKDQQKQDEQKPQDQKPEDQQKQKQQEEQQSKQEQAESTLRKAREREREHREKQRELRALIQQGIKVERDW